MTGTKLKAGRQTVELSNADKVLFPEDGITKGDLAGYYRDAAGLMLPLLRDRPVSMTRFPDGITRHAIVQKNVPTYFPDWITRARVPKEGGSLQQVVIDKPATLVYLAGQACIELHAFSPGWTGSASPTSSSSTSTHRTTTGSMTCGCARCGCVTCCRQNWACLRS